MQDLHKTLSYDEAEILRSIIALYAPTGIDLDPTYSKGAIYKHLPQPRIKFDIDPKCGVPVEDVRALPLKDRSVSSVLFDPPFLATKGESIKADDDSNLMVKRFGVYPTEDALHEFYVDALRELHRVLEVGGVLIVKCQDKVSSGKQYFSHIFIYLAALQIGFYAKDLFVLGAKARMVADWQRNQKHARKFHCYYWVFVKDSKAGFKQLNQSCNIRA